MNPNFDTTIMETWSPIFARIVDSSIWEEPDHVVKVFLTMLAKKDLDHVVRGSAFNISRWARKTEAEVLDALKVLSSPDLRRMEPQPHEGRRIKRVADGWLILNGQYYEDMMQVIARRMKKAAAERERRRRIKAQGQAGGPMLAENLAANGEGFGPDGDSPVPVAQSGGTAWPEGVGNEDGIL